MTDADVEHVLVVPTELFHSIGHFQGFCGDVDRYLDTLFAPSNITLSLKTSHGGGSKLQAVDPICDFSAC